ncbi:RluA family pseudouridine synthase [Acinetobacter rathckeae]|uniref:RluA family pseudouridine synthase n=1 Tax=Acinetobacter rathckeae TaxID=2605272 RepID=UPI001D18E090|nr:RluA family pseudouridine synthase [Acinetobacter rathckeae]
MPDFLTNHLIHKDEDFMVIHKPAGLLSVPGKGEALHDSVLTRLVQEEPKTLLIHRLDRDTSGLLIFALTRLGQNSISRQFQERQTHKVYQALVAGHLEGHGCIDIPVIYDPSRPPLHIVDANHHKPAITHWTALEHFEIDGQAVTRVELVPITGRAHQLRVHLQHLGHPIVGDTLYASLAQQQLKNRLCLHAYKISFTNPKTAQTEHFECPVPF